MKRLLIDSSSIVMEALHAARSGENSDVVMHEGKEVIIPSAVDGYEIFLSNLERTLEFLQMVPSQIVLVKDGENSRDLRRKFLKGYKDRKPQAPEFYTEFNSLQDRVERTLWSYGAISAVKEGFEADDLIAAIAKETEHIIWSKDKDLLAAGDWFYGGELNPDKFFGIKKEHIVVFKSIVGDPSDKIPGAKGFGEKAFINLVTKFGDEGLQDLLDMLEEGALDELEYYVSEFKPLQRILDSQASVYASYKCAKFYHPGWNINFEARFPETNGDLPKWNRTETLVTADNFSEKLAEVSAEFNKASKFLGFIGFDIETWQDEESKEWGLKNKSKTSKYPKLDVYGSYMAGFSITAGDNNQHVYYFSVDHKDTNNISIDDMKETLNSLPDSIRTLVHNALFELPVVRKHMELRFDRGFLNNVIDTMIEKSYVDENTSLGLKYCSNRFLKYKQISFSEVTQGKEMNELTAEEVLKYGADDAVVTTSLHSLFRLIMDYEGTSNAFDKVELKPPYLYAQSFLHGIKFDMNRLFELERENLREFNRLKKEISDILIKIDDFPGTFFVPADKFSPGEVKRLFRIISGCTLNTKVRKPEKLCDAVKEVSEEYKDFAEAVRDEDINAMNSIAEAHFVPKPEFDLGSPKKKAELLYDFLGFPVRLYGKLTNKMRKEGRKKGNRSADINAFKLALIHDADEDEKILLNKIIKWTELKTEQGLYFNPYKQMPNPKSGMVHFNPGHSQATTRRNTPNGPNIAQVSKKTPIREVYTTFNKDQVWVSFDWSGQELRLTAYRSGCEVMRACYPWGKKALDIHSKTGAQISKGEMSYEEVNLIRKDPDHPLHKKAKAFRNAAKAVNFGDVYGQEKEGLALKLLITDEEAQEIIEAKAKAFPGVAKWKRDNIERFKRDGFTTTPLGARKHMKITNSWKDKHEFRSGTNYDIQSPAGEQMKLAVTKIWDRRILEEFSAYFMFPVHDELNFLINKDVVREFIKVVHGIMVEKYADMDLPVESSIEVGPNFGELIEIDEDLSNLEDVLNA